MFSFKALLKAWRSGGLISDMFSEFSQMMEKAADTFEEAHKALSGEFDLQPAFEEVRRRDREINATEALIRRQLVQHLTVQAGSDVTLSLILMSIVKDAERAGDYCRDLFGVAFICSDAAKTEGFAESIEELFSGVGRLMEDSRRALSESDEELARDVMDREKRLKADCDSLLDKLVKSGLSSERTVALTMIICYLRRITAHTANISSGVINPVERLDHSPRD